MWKMGNFVSRFADCKEEYCAVAISEDSTPPIKEKVALQLLQQENIDELKKNETSILKVKFKKVEENLLHQACKLKNISRKTMQYLVRIFSEDPSQIEELKRKGFPEIDRLHEVNTDCQEALHIAILFVNLIAVEELLKKIKPENLDRRCKESTPYSLLMLKAKRDISTEEERKKCFDLLVEHNVDLKKYDVSGKNPLFWASKSCGSEFWPYLLEQAKQGKLLIDDEKIKNKIVNQLGEETWNDIKKKSAALKLSPDDLLFQSISKSEEKVGDCLQRTLDRLKGDGKLNAHIINADNQSHTLLQKACANNIEIIVNMLLKVEGIDCQRRIPQNKKTPVEIALGNRSQKIIDALIAHKTFHTGPRDRKDRLIIRILKDNYKIDWKMCPKKLECLMTILKSYVTESQGSPMMFINLDPAIATQFLIENNISLAQKNEKGELNSKYCELETLEGYLDHNIKEYVKYGLPEDTFVEDYKLSFNFGPLLPRQMANQDETSRNCNETSLNGHENSKNGTANGTSDSTVIDISNQKTNYFRETDLILMMSMSEKQKPILKHPLVTAFLKMKWTLMKKIFWLNLYLYIFFNITLCFYVYFSSITETGPGYIFSLIFLIITLLLLWARESFEMYVLRKKYFSFNENLYENTVFILTTILITWELITDGGKDFRTGLSIFLPLLSWSSLVLALERMPNLSVKMVMLKRVSITFFKTFLLYSVFFIPFATSFLTLYSQNGANFSERTNGTQKFFNNFFLTQFKSIIMMSGEFELNDSIDIDTHPFVSPILFMLFVLLVSIIGFNLLTGLAVSETKAIKDEAKLYGLISKTIQICYIESLLDGYCKRIGNNSDHAKNLKSRFCLAPGLTEIKVHPHVKGKVSVDGKAHGKHLKKLGDTLSRAALKIVYARMARERQKNKESLQDIQTKNHKMETTIATFKKGTQSLQETVKSLEKQLQSKQKEIDDSKAIMEKLQKLDSGLSILLKNSK